MLPATINTSIENELKNDMKVTIKEINTTISLLRPYFKERKSIIFNIDGMKESVESINRCIDENSTITESDFFQLKSLKENLQKLQTKFIPKVVQDMFDELQMFLNTLQTSTTNQRAQAGSSSRDKGVLELISRLIPEDMPRISSENVCEVFEQIRDKQSRDWRLAGISEINIKKLGYYFGLIIKTLSPDYTSNPERAFGDSEAHDHSSLNSNYAKLMNLSQKNDIYSGSLESNSEKITNTVDPIAPR